MCDPILVTLLKMPPHYSQSSRENATPSSGTSPVASYGEVPPPLPPGIYAKGLLCWDCRLVTKCKLGTKCRPQVYYRPGSKCRLGTKLVLFTLIWVKFRLTKIAHCRNVRGLGKSMVVFSLFKKPRHSNERSTKFESLEQV